MFGKQLAALTVWPGLDLVPSFTTVRPGSPPALAAPSGVWILRDTWQGLYIVRPLPGAMIRVIVNLQMAEMFSFPDGCDKAQDI